jgi:hypothetical protein
MTRLACSTAAVLALLPTFVASPAAGNEAQAALASMSTAERNETLARVIQESGKTCDRVEKSMYQGTGPGSKVALWSVRCSNSEDLVVLVYPDAEGSTGVSTCREIAKIAPCWVQLAPAPTSATPAQK